MNIRLRTWLRRFAGIFLLLISPILTAYAGNKAESDPVKINFCTNTDLAFYLDNVSNRMGQHLEKNALYHTSGLMAVQKLKHGYIVTPNPARWGNGSMGMGYGAAFLATDHSFNESAPLDGWVYYTGDYSYTGLNGFEQKVPMVKLYQKSFSCPSK